MKEASILYGQDILAGGIPATLAAYFPEEILSFSWNIKTSLEGEAKYLKVNLPLLSPPQFNEELEFINNSIKAIIPLKCSI